MAEVMDLKVARCMKLGWPAHTHNCMKCGDADGRSLARAGGLFLFVVDDPDDPLDGHDLLLCERCCREWADANDYETE